jgi:hypothetical protein
MKFKQFVNRFALLVAATFALQTPAWAKGGSMDGGGGLGFRTPTGTYRLWDLQRFEASEAETILGSPLKVIREVHPAGVIWIDFADFSDHPAREILAEKLSYWQKSSPAFVSLLKSALNGIDILVIDQRFGQIELETFALPLSATNIPKDSLQWIARFACVELFCGPGLSKLIFDKLDLRSQAALLVHEALREIARQFESSLSDDQIEKLTYSFMSHKIENGVSLDDPSLYNGELAAYFLGGGLQVTRVVNEACRKLSTLKNQCTDKQWTRSSGLSASTPQSVEVIFCQETSVEQIARKLNGTVTDPELAVVEQLYRRVDDVFETLRDCDLNGPSTESHRLTVRDLLSKTQDAYWALIASRLSTNQSTVARVSRQVRRTMVGSRLGL